MYFIASILTYTIEFTSTEMNTLICNLCFIYCSQEKFVYNLQASSSSLRCRIYNNKTIIMDIKFNSDKVWIQLR